MPSVAACSDFRKDGRGRSRTGERKRSDPIIFNWKFALGNWPKGRVKESRSVQCCSTVGGVVGFRLQSPHSAPAERQSTGRVVVR